METTYATPHEESLTRKCWKTYAISLAQGAGLMTGAILAAAVFRGPTRVPKVENATTNT